ncbi:amidohydrolase family protein [Muricauda sp. 2012CJ35-5]|uniref:Amidohydrolase family protein n=1 Tax=Flagellimonas spongiicola TaxID=2942208 RepID=A0ABT0PS89_9FLAO|nr:amidohydrolase family protein [Allomuricauda spongiicola]MCL6274260.1 amidohydrolase family protein [Allomuricauda spongiicola]
MRTVLALLVFVFFVSCTNTNNNTNYESRDYQVFMRDNLAGTHSSAMDEEGNYIYEFEFNDRGRGPELKEKIQLDVNGNLSTIEISGVNYLKDSVSETFSFSNGLAKWNNNSEAGEKTTDGSPFYSSINGTLGDNELLIRRMLASEHQSITLLPSGSARISSIEEITVDSIPLRLVEITGFGFTPFYQWIDSNDRIFATVSSWVSIIQEENVSLLPDLLEYQDKKEDAFFASLATELTEEPAGKLIINNVSLFDSNKGILVPHQTVTINGNQIESVVSTTTNIDENAQIIDGSGKTLLPGLFDNHCHVQKEDGILHLAAGVTSVRDMANSMELLEMKKQFDENSNVGPRVVTLSGFIDQKGPFAGPGLTISNVAEGEEAIQNYKDHGYQQIKLYSSIDPSWVKPLAKKTHDLGMKVSGHIPAHMLAEQAIKDGFDEIQHVNMVALNFLSDTIDTRTPLRFSAVAEHTHALDIKSETFQEFVALLKDKDIELDPTVSIFEGMFTSKPGEPDPQFAAILDRLPIQVQRGFYSVGLPIPSDKEQQYKDSFEKLLEIIQELHNQGVTILPGTDALPGFALHKELENYVRAGIPANEVLQLATITSAQVTKMDHQLGSIEKGKLADMILVDGDPLEDISTIRKVALTIKDGRIYHPKNLYAALGIGHYE